MLIWWKGLGLLVPVIWAVLMFVAVVTRGFFHEKELFIINSIAKYIFMFLPAIIVWKLGKKLNRKKDEIVHVEEETGKEIKFGYQHSLFSIPFEFWAVAIIIFNIMYRYMY